MRGREWDISNGTKPCPQCGETKQLSEFGTNAYTKTGFSVYCKACMAAKARERRATPEGKKAHYKSTLKWIAGLPDQETANGMKTCPKCQIQKEFARYPKNRRNKHGIGTYCLECSAAIVRERRATEEGAQVHRDASKRWRENNLAQHKDMGAKWRYGIEYGGYDKMLETQQGKCAICETTEPGKGLTRFHVDHCHNSKTVRGLLCEHCNRGLGHYKDDPALLRRAADYLDLSQTSR